MAQRVEVNSAVLQQYLDGEHGVEARLEQKAQGALARAQAVAPVESGAYKASLRIETDHTDRMVKRVVADVPYAMQVEARDGVLAKALP